MLGDDPVPGAGRRASALADGCLDPSAQRLCCADLVKQPPSEAVVVLSNHREKHMLRSNEKVTSHGGELLRLAQ